MTKNLLFGLALLFSVAAIHAEDEEKPESDSAAKLRKVLDRSAEAFQITPRSSPPTALQPKLVLTWTNNERDSDSIGVVRLWIDRGQPAVAMATYTWMNGIHHEFDLLSRDPVNASDGQQQFWQPKSGLKFHPIPAAPAVDRLPAARLRQMKELSSQFSATMMGWRPDKSDRAELRRLPRELYRYQPETPAVIDGAVFAFVMGNDPEALLLVEAVNDKQGSRWEYAFVRQTSGALEARHDNQVVWSVPQHGARNDVTADGYSLRSALNLKAELAK